MGNSAGKTPSSSYAERIARAKAQGNPLHFVLRVPQRAYGAKTYDEHAAMIEHMGCAWIGLWGGKVGSWAVDLAKAQLAAGVMTFLFLRLSPRLIYQATLVDVAGGGLAPELQLVPEYYRDERCSVWFKMDSLKQCDGEVQGQLRNFLEQGAPPAFNSQRSLFFVTLPG